MRRYTTKSSISRKLLCAVTVPFLASAQSVQVFSPYTRVDPFGSVVGPDRGRPAREILSPALPRNAHSGFHLVISGEPGAAYELWVGQNPENAVAATIYREIYVQQSGQWIPDGLEKLELPFRGVLGETGIPRQTAQAFWMDFLVARDAPVDRIKIEPEVRMEERWIRYPMEARIVFATAPDSTGAGIAPAPVGSPADITARKVLNKKLCNRTEKNAASTPLNIRDFIAREAAQDVAMASVLSNDVLWSLTAAPDRAAWCRADVPHPEGPEWFLRVHDRIIGAKK